MRFNRLDILRYGALTDRTIDFRSDARLHLVYGPNEAGKSSALSAISDLLFGFSRVARDAARSSFLHDAPTLRIGATISSRDGAMLTFRRRRGNKNTLLAADERETALAEDALSPFLGNLSRDVFERAFGLDSERLRQGAAAMLQSGGEIGSLLFSAASGLTGLSQLRKSLEEQSESIYAQRRSKDRSFYQALDRHDEARKAERDHELKSSDWKKLLTEEASFDAALTALEAERLATRTTLEELRAAKKLEPLLREIDGEHAALAEFAEIAALPQGFEQQLAAALEAVDNGRSALSAVEKELERLKGDLASSPVDERIFAAAALIMGRYAEKGGYLKSREDLSRVQGEVEDFDLKLVQLGRRLGLDMDAEGLARSQPAEADLIGLRAVVVEGRDLTRNHADILHRLEEDRNRLARLEGAERAGRLVDPKPYLDQMAALQSDLADLARLDRLKVSLEREQATLDEAVARLQPDIHDLDQLLAKALPDISFLTDARSRIDQLKAAVKEASAKLAAHDAEHGELVTERAALEGDGALVTRDDIVVARAERTRLWKAYVARADNRTAESVDHAISEADRLSDLALDDAERVSRHAQLTFRLVALEQAGILGARRKQEADAALAVAIGDFEALFTPLDIIPLAPERMIDWRRGIDGLVKQRQAVHVLQDELAEVRLAGQRLKPALTALADATGLAGSETLPVRALGRALFAHVSDLSQRWTDSRAAEGERQSIAEAVDRHEVQESKLRKEAELWQRRFVDAAGRINLSEHVTVEMAETVLDLWKDVPPMLAERENRSRRVRGMRRDIAAFEENVRALVEDAAPDLKTYAADAAMDVLRDRAITATADQQHRTTLFKAIEAAELRQSRCKQVTEEAEAMVASLASSLPKDTDLRPLLAQLRELRTLQERLAASRRRFHEQAEGQSEEAARTRLVRFVRVEAELEIERLEAQDSGQLRRFGELTAQRAENLRQRAALETGTSAEYAVFQKLSAEQEARDLARQWVVMKLAAHMLGSSMEAYREQQADPVMTRAGTLLSMLTGGRFTRLVQDYGTDDQLQLLAERSSGERVPLDGLSEGTGDQFYLALRLAFLEDYATRNEPAPLVVDDIFQTFDDARTASGLRALAGTADRFQTILFTHEMSVVDIARRELGSSLDLIQL